MKERASNIYEEMARLRAVVGFLGEKSQHNWWDTNFLSDSGQQFLKIIFPRSAVSAGCNAVVEAAKRLHDERIGKDGVYHLFRLPASIEEAVHGELLSIEPEDIRHCLLSKDVAMECLKRLFPASIEASVGPVQVGPEKQILTSHVLNSIASHYYSAFQRETMCFPYFVGG